MCSMATEQAHLDGVDAAAGRRPRRERIAGKRTEATILHADLDSFYASVEQRDDPSLRGKPITVGGGVVLAASYEAKRFGVRAAMPGGEARRLCPNLIDVPARFDAYVEASKAVYAIFDDTTPIVEPMSIDEAFLDVAGLWRLVGTPRVIAERLRERVADEVGLPITVGVARTKFLAKVASGVGKPDGLLVVEPDGELAFLHPLPVERLWGVGVITAAKLNNRGVYTVGEVAGMDERALTAIVGRNAGSHLHALAHNRDPRRVEGGRRRGSIGSQQALGRRRRSRDDLDVVLRRLVDRVTGRMRKAGRVGRTVTLRFRFDDFTRADEVALPARRDGVDRGRGRHRARLVRRELGADRGARAHAARVVGRQPARRGRGAADPAVRPVGRRSSRRGGRRGAWPLRRLLPGPCRHDARPPRHHDPHAPRLTA